MALDTANSFVSIPEAYPHDGQVTDQPTKPSHRDILKEMGQIRDLVSEACAGLENVSSAFLIKETLKQFQVGMSHREVIVSLIVHTRSRIEQEPNYSQVAARLLLAQLRSEALSFLSVDSSDKSTQVFIGSLYENALPRFIKKAIAISLLPSELASFDLEQLSSAIVPERDMQFGYAELEALYDRHFLQFEGCHFELPQIFFMRIAMETALKEGQSEQKAINLYHLFTKQLDRDVRRVKTNGKSNINKLPINNMISDKTKSIN